MDPIHRVVVEDYSDMPPLLPGTEVETTAATNEAGTGAQSDASLPSLQTVSDSSDEDLESEDGDEDEDDYVSDDGESLGDEPPLLTRPIPFPGSSADLLGVGATAQARPRRPAQVSDFEVEEFRSAFVDSHISTNTMERAMRTAIDIRMLEHALTASDTRVCHSFPIFYQLLVNLTNHVGDRSRRRAPKYDQEPTTTIHL